VAHCPQPTIPVIKRFQATSQNATLPTRRRCLMLDPAFPRPEWELFDRKTDPSELRNVAEKPRYQVAPPPPPCAHPPALCSPSRPVLTLPPCAHPPALCSPSLCSPQAVLATLKSRLSVWQQATADPWLCAPHAGPPSPPPSHSASE
jgi:hypothetical protein